MLATTVYEWENCIGYSLPAVKQIKFGEAYRWLGSNDDLANRINLLFYNSANIIFFAYKWSPSFLRDSQAWMFVLMIQIYYVEKYFTSRRLNWSLTNVNDQDMKN